MSKLNPISKERKLTNSDTGTTEYIWQKIVLNDNCKTPDDYNLILKSLGYAPSYLLLKSIEKQCNDNKGRNK